MNGYIFLHKKIIETSFYKNPLATRLAVHLLLMANYKNTKTSVKYKEIIVKRGQLLTGRLTLSRQTGISQQSIRTSLDFLRTIGFLTIESTNQYSIITIVKYSDYQITPTEPPANQPATNQQLTSNQPATNQQLTTTEELKDLKELKELKEKVQGPAPAPSPSFDLANLWNTLTTNKLAHVNDVTRNRRLAISARLKDTAKELNQAEYWQKVIERMSQSDFCLGQNDRGWKAGFDWFIRPDTHIKIMEGKYDNRAKKNTDDRFYPEN